MATLTFVTTTSAQVVSVTPAPCISPAMNARVSASVPSTLSQPRVFFRANGQGPEYYIDMRPGPNGWWAMLPAIDNSTKWIMYRVGGLDSSRHWVLSNPITLPAIAACPAQNLTRDEQLAAQHIVLGQTAVNQAAVPAGFSCRGVTNVIAANGQMRRADDCHAAGLVPASTAASATAHGASATALELAAFAAGGLAAGYAVGHAAGNRKQVSPSH